MLVKGGGTYRVYSQVCGIVWCDGEDWPSCAVIDQVVPPDDDFGPFLLEGTFSVEAVFPTGIRRNLSLVPNSQLELAVSGTVTSIEAQNGVNSLLSVELFGRWYNRDP